MAHQAFQSTAYKQVAAVAVPSPVAAVVRQLTRITSI